MKKILIVAFSIIMVFLVSCKTNNNSSLENASESEQTISPTSSSNNTNFEYFFRGFIAADKNDISLNDSNVKLENITSVIETEDDWVSFMEKYCPGIPYFTEIDFSKESLIAYIYQGAKPTWNSTIDISNIEITNNQVYLNGEMNNSTAAIAINSKNCNNFGIVIVKVNKKDLPTGLKNIYKK